MTDRVESLAALLQQAHVAWANLLKVPADGVTDATEAMQAAVDGERLWLAKWLIARGVTVGSRLGEPSPEAIEELAYKISGLTIGVPDLSPPASRLREIAAAWLRAAYAVDFGVRAGSEETP